MTSSGELRSFGWILQYVSSAAGRIEKAHYQTAFAPMLLGVVCAIILVLFLKETGSAANMSPSREA
jgi:hypothetical protein